MNAIPQQLTTFFKYTLLVFAFTAQAQTTITVGTGTGSGTSIPIASWYNSSATESIYLGSELGATGNITKIAFNKASGNSTVAPSVKIYMKTTLASAVGTTAYNIGTSGFAGYTLVYDGTLPNNTTSGWMEATLTTPFSYTTTVGVNLSVLVIGSTCIESGRPQYRYTTTSARMTGSFNDGSIACGGTASWNATASMSPVLERPNMQFTFSALGTETPVKSQKNLISYIQDNSLYLVSEGEMIREVNLYDLSGRRLQNAAFNASEVVLPVTAKNQLLIANITLEDGSRIVRKFIF